METAITNLQNVLNLNTPPWNFCADTFCQHRVVSASQLLRAERCFRCLHVSEFCSDHQRLQMSPSLALRCLLRMPSKNSSAFMFVRSSAWNIPLCCGPCRACKSHTHCFSRPALKVLRAAVKSSQFVLQFDSVCAHGSGTRVRYQWPRMWRISSAQRRKESRSTSNSSPSCRSEQVSMRWLLK